VELVPCTASAYRRQRKEREREGGDLRKGRIRKGRGKEGREKGKRDKNFSSRSYPHSPSRRGRGRDATRSVLCICLLDLVQARIVGGFLAGRPTLLPPRFLSSL